MRAYLSIATKGASSIELANLIEKLRRTKGVLLADSISGKFDAIAVVEAPDVDALKQMVSQLSEDNPIIARIETSIATWLSPAAGG